MRILSVATWLPYPEDHPVKRRIWHLLERLAAEEEVTLIAWADDTVAPEHIQHVRERVAELILLRRRAVPLGLAGRLAREARAHATALPTFVQVIREEREPAPVPPGRFDLVIAEDEPALFLLPPVSAPVVVHRLNTLRETIAELAACDTFPLARRLKWRLEHHVWSRYERKLSDGADLNLAVSAELADALRALRPSAPMAVVPQGVRLPPRAVRPAEGPVAVFLGTLNYDPNVDAIRWFCREVWPRVQERVADAELRIVGRAPDPSVLALAGPGVRVVGEVPDILEACDGARVAVSPLRAGWGVKTKSIEMMAMGLPLVASPRGAEGIGGTPADGLWVAGDARSFADVTAGLLLDAEAAARGGANARRFCAERLPWDGPPRDYVELLRRFVGPRDASPGAVPTEAGAS